MTIATPMWVGWAVGMVAVVVIGFDVDLQWWAPRLFVGHALLLGGWTVS